jgi:Ni,Fe-hydrogenase III large subunit
MKDTEKLLRIVITKLDRIYSHLEVDWDKLSENELEARYKSMQLILSEIKNSDNLLLGDIEEDNLNKKSK